MDGKYLLFGYFAVFFILLGRYLYMGFKFSKYICSKHPQKAFEIGCLGYSLTSPYILWKVRKLFKEGDTEDPHLLYLARSLWNAFKLIIIWFIAGPLIILFIYFVFF